MVMEPIVQENLTEPAKEITSGYDLEPVGLDTGIFISMHASALTCISTSLLSAFLVILIQFRFNRNNFFLWSIGERLCVYLAVSDGAFNVCHFMDHMHMIVTKWHVTPSSLCTFYAAMIGWFMEAQMFMVLCIAVNSFWVVSFGRKLPWGRRDAYLNLFTFGTPLVIMALAIPLKVYGPSGASCYVDAAHPMAFNVLLVIPMAIVLIVAAILYVLTWKKIVEKSQAMNKFRQGREAVSTRAAKTMMMFVVSFTVQWHIVPIYGIWAMMEPPGLWAFYYAITVPNLGGFFNGIVYTIIRRERFNSDNNSSTTVSTVSAKKSQKHSASIN